jgi:hypothetical protein
MGLVVFAGPLALQKQPTAQALLKIILGVKAALSLSGDFAPRPLLNN